MRVLKISHSSVVSAWRQRERELIAQGIDLSLVTAKAWEEGGSTVAFEADGDNFAVGVRAWGHRPNVFLFDPRPLWRLIGQQWSLIDIHEEPCSLAMAEILFLRLMRSRRTPFVLYSAQNIDKRYPPPFRWTERIALRGAAMASVCNRAAGQILKGKGLRGRVEEIPLGVDVDRYRPADRPPPVGRLRVGYVGRLATHKGVGVLLESIASRADWALEMVGGGPAEQDLRRRAAELAMSDRVTFAGPLEEDRLPERYRSFDVVAIPSIPTPDWEEQFCRVAVEAMASGVPVIASRSGALPEVVGDAGILVKPGDANELSAALDALATSCAHWTRLRAAGLSRAKRYTWKAVADDYHRLYESAIER